MSDEGRNMPQALRSLTDTSYAVITPHLTTAGPSLHSSPSCCHCDPELMDMLRAFLERPPPKDSTHSPSLGSSFAEYQKKDLAFKYRMDRFMKHQSAYNGFADESKPPPPDLWGLRFEMDKAEAKALAATDYEKDFLDRMQTASYPFDKACAFKISGPTLRIFGNSKEDANALLSRAASIPGILGFKPADEGPARPVSPRFYVALFGFRRHAEFEGLANVTIEAKLLERMRMSNPDYDITGVQIRNDHLVVVVSDKTHQAAIVQREYMCCSGQLMRAYRWDLRCELFMCHNCSKANHRKSTCENETKCPYCSKGHELHECGAKAEDEKNHTVVGKQCPNCTEANLKNPDLNLETNHAAYDRQCPCKESVEMRERAARFRRYQMNLPAHLVNAMANLDSPKTLAPQSQRTKAPAKRGSKSTTGTGTSKQGRTATTTRGRDPKSNATATTTKAATAATKKPGSTTAAKGKQRAVAGVDDDEPTRPESRSSLASVPSIDDMAKRGEARRSQQSGSRPNGRRVSASGTGPSAFGPMMAAAGKPTTTTAKATSSKEKGSKALATKAKAPVAKKTVSKAATTQTTSSSRLSPGSSSRVLLTPGATSPRTSSPTIASPKATDTSSAQRMPAPAGCSQPRDTRRTGPFGHPRRSRTPTHASASQAHNPKTPTRIPKPSAPRSRASALSPRSPAGVLTPPSLGNPPLAPNVRSRKQVQDDEYIDWKLVDESLLS